MGGRLGSSALRDRDRAGLVNCCGCLVAAGSESGLGCCGRCDRGAPAVLPVPVAAEPILLGLGFRLAGGLALSQYLPELLPPQLLYKIEAAEKATPLPLFAEMLLVILILEIIREAGLRMPQSLGHSVSLVSALIIGDAAIATGLMSTPVIFVASITAIAVFVTPGLYEPATLLRIGTVLLAGLAGPVGLAAAFFGFLLSIVSTEALGVPYLAPHPFPQQPLSEDGVLRRNYRQLSRHGFNIWQKRERGKRQT